MADSQQELMMLLEKLNNVDDLRDVRSVRSNIYEILTLSTNGSDVAAALPTIVKLMAHSDAFVKRVAGELIAVYAEKNPEIVLLASNTLIQDCKDVNPVVRGHALQVLGSLPSESVVEMLSSAIIAGLQDNSPYVRKGAALVTVSLYHLSPASVTEGGLWDMLYTHLSDSDPLTVASCMCALEEIFAKEKGIVISNKLGQYLISNFMSYTLAVQRFVLQFLLKHSPKTKSQVFDHLNDLDESLSKSRSLATTLCSLELFCHLANNLPKVKSKAYSSAWLAIKTNLASERNEEIVTAVIDYLCTTDFPVSVLISDHSKFFCKNDDSAFLVKQKLRILSKLITTDNAENIFDEFVRSARHLNAKAIQEMFQNLKDAIYKGPEIETACVQFLNQLLKLGNIVVLECVFQFLSTIKFSDVSHWSSLAPNIQDYQHQISSIPGRVALLEIIQSHGDLLDDAPEILEQIMHDHIEKDFDDEEKVKVGELCNSLNNQSANYNSQRLKLALLGAMVKLCLKHPAKLQPLLAKLMEQCIKDKNRSVRDRALFLFGDLIGKAKHISIQ